MQVFVPYKEPLKCAETLWSDQKRYNKQIIECRQIIDAIDGKLAWKNHPVTLMYKPYREWLSYYMECLISYRHFNKATDGSNGELIWKHETLYNNEEANKITPPFLTEEFCDNHKRRLYTKDNELYPQFKEYGITEENWYFVDNELRIYKNGKRIK